MNNQKFVFVPDDSNPKDPREKPVPPRPKGQRPEPESTGGSTFGGFGGFGGGGKLQKFSGYILV